MTERYTWGGDGRDRLDCSSLMPDRKPPTMTDHLAEARRLAREAQRHADDAVRHVNRAVRLGNIALVLQAAALVALIVAFALKATS